MTEENRYPVVPNIQWRDKIVEAISFMPKLKVLRLFDWRGKMIGIVPLNTEDGADWMKIHAKAERDYLTRGYEFSVLDDIYEGEPIFIATYDYTDMAEF